MAVACAVAFGVDQLIFLTDVAGVLDAGKKLLPRLTMAHSQSLIAAGIATGGMLAKLNAAHSALSQGVGACGFARGRKPACWKESWRARTWARAGAGGGIGKMISGLTEETVAEHGGRAEIRGDVVVRKAAMHDIGPILALINGYAAKGVMLPRTELEVSEDIRDFSVIVVDGRMVGCGALHFYTPGIGEIRSLAVAEDVKTNGIGRRLIDALVREASQYALDAVFAFTYVAGFFGKMGFQIVERGELPLKAWKDCVRCPKFQCCDEIAVMRFLRPEHRGNLQYYRQLEDSQFVQLPVLRG